MKKLTQPREDLLRRLADAGGTLKGKSLSVPARRLASQMQGDGLVKWEPPADRCGNLDAWSLHVTDDGLAALAGVNRPQV